MTEIRQPPTALPGAVGLTHLRVYDTPAPDGCNGGIIWFSPGVIHRLINLDGRRESFVVMQNGGLPEAGERHVTAVSSNPP